MLPHRVPVAAASGSSRQQIVYYLICLLLLLTTLQLLQFLYRKCDTRVHMSSLLSKTSQILTRHNVEYWLDKGTLLGVYRDDGLIPWEYDVDLGVMNATCDKISALKTEFEAVGLTAYDRQDDIPHKVKLTYDTETHEFYWSDPKLHDPCIRVYDTTDTTAWVDIYWYVELTAEEVMLDHEKILVPPDYDMEDNLVCCSEGLQAYTEHMCCGGCVPRKSLFPLQHKFVNIHNGVDPVQEQPVPAEVGQILSIQYGKNVLTSREIKVRRKRVEGHSVWFLDESAAIYSAPGPARRRGGSTGDHVSTQVLYKQLQATKALEVHCQQDYQDMREPNVQFTST